MPRFPGQHQVVVQRADDAAQGLLAVVLLAALVGEQRDCQEGAKERQESQRTLKALRRP